MVALQFKEIKAATAPPVLVQLTLHIDFSLFHAVIINNCGLFRGMKSVRWQWCKKSLMGVVIQIYLPVPY
jgi:hypothetical protein